jgi:hypothetical protein
MSAQAQSFETHAKMVPGYHYVATGFLVLPTMYFLYSRPPTFPSSGCPWRRSRSA